MLNRHKIEQYNPLTLAPMLTFTSFLKINLLLLLKHVVGSVRRYNSVDSNIV
jgi:hypothetical protein